MEIESDDHLYGKNFQNSYMHLLTFQMSSIYGVSKWEMPVALVMANHLANGNVYDWSSIFFNCLIQSGEEEEELQRCGHEHSDFFFFIF